MWTREQLKTNAKGRLSYFFWPAFLACLLSGILTGGAQSISTGLQTRFQLQYQVSSLEQLPPEAYSLLLGETTVVGLVGILLAIFVGNVVAVGLCRFFMEGREHPVSFSALFSAFRVNYGNVVKTQLLTNLSVFLWSLLFVVPGIIKSYQYCMVPYLLSENPHMDAARAKELSRWMTDGEKMDIFVLELSFIGWSLLCALTCGLGYLFLAPYIQATFAELYEALREKALAYGTASPQELPGFGYML